MSSSLPKKDGFTVVDSSNIKDLLTNTLVPVVDKIRDIHTQLGGRVYTVRVIKTQWSGGRRGLGVESVIDILDILPTPQVVDLSSLSEVVTPIGLEETGAVQVSQISGRFTEELLLGVDSVGREPAPDVNVFYEIEFPRPNGASVLRRFHISSAPSYSPYAFQWRISLTKADENRAVDGSPR